MRTLEKFYRCVDGDTDGADYRYGDGYERNLATAFNFKQFVCSIEEIHEWLSFF